MNSSKYFIQALLVVVFSTLSFIVFKEFLPKKIFPESTVNSKNVVVDSLLLEAIAEEGALKEKDTLSNKIIDFKVVNGRITYLKMFLFLWLDCLSHLDKN